MHLYADALKQLQQRTWLLHWALFIFWNTSDGAAQLLDLCLQDKFTVAMQVNSPHLLRSAPLCSCTPLSPPSAPHGHAPGLAQCQPQPPHHARPAGPPANQLDPCHQPDQLSIARGWQGGS